MHHRLRFLIIELVTIFIWVLGFCHSWEKSALPFELQDSMSISSPDTSVSTVLRKGDTLKIVDSIRIRSQNELEFILDNHSVGDTVSLRIMGTISPEPYIAEVIVKRFYSPAYFVIILLTAGLLFATGYIVRTRRHIDKDVELFHLLCLGMGTLVMTSSGHYPMALGIGYLVSAVFYTAFTFTPVLLLMFSRVFPNDRHAETVQLQDIIIKVAAILAGLLTISFIVAATNSSLSIFKFHFILFRISQILFAGIVVLAAVSFYLAYQTSVQESDRRKILWVATGGGITLVLFLGLWFVPRFVNGHPLLPTMILSLLITLPPIFIAIAMIHYRIKDITNIINRSAVYSLVVVASFVAYLVVYGIVLKIGGGLTSQTTFIVTAIMAVTTVLYLSPLKKIIGMYIDKRLFPSVHLFQNAEQSLIEQFASAKSSMDLALILRRYISELLSAERVGVFIYDDKKLRLIAHNGLEELSEFGAELGIIHRLASEKKDVGVHQFIEPEANIEPAEDELFESLNMVLLFPVLSQNNEPMGCIGIGQKKSGAKYTAEDCDIIVSARKEYVKGLERIAMMHQMSAHLLESGRSEELNRMKSYFVSGVSHELKTPLTAIQMFSEMLRSRTEGAKAQEYLNTIEGESARLSRMIDTVLDFAQVERGIKEYYKKPAELSSIVRNVISVLHYEIKKEGFTIETNFAITELLFTADTDAIAEALINLIGNAIKFSRQEHSIKVSTFEKKGFVCVSVEDKGIGIPTESFHEIFKPFIRLKNEATQQIGGSGLGLALVRHIAEGHGGRVEVESKVNRGSKFTLMFVADGKE